MAAPLLDIRSLSISFQGKEVLRNVSLQINPGETLGLVGESGSGKSLTSLSILRLNPGLATGSIWLQHKGSNIDVLKWPKSRAHDLFKSILYVWISGNGSLAGT
jgi:ABC-type glutathione transport system ATPase component